MTLNWRPGLRLPMLLYFSSDAMLPPCHSWSRLREDVVESLSSSSSSSSHDSLYRSQKLSSLPQSRGVTVLAVQQSDFFLHPTFEM
jgi:hypothetical protein